MRGPQVSTTYVTCRHANAASKIDGLSTHYSVLSTKNDSQSPTVHTSCHDIWHRTGDLGYFDNQGRLWYCGRKSDRLHYGNDVTLYPVQCEAIINTCKRVRQSAIVYCGARPVLVVELNHDDPGRDFEPPPRDLIQELKVLKDKHAILKDIDHLFVCPQMPWM